MKVGSPGSKPSDAGSMPNRSPRTGRSSQRRGPPRPRQQDCQASGSSTAGGAPSSAPAEASGPICATCLAASGPDSSSIRKPASSRIGTLSDTALSYLLPGFSPTTTKAVLDDTDPAALAPRSSNSALASSREYPVRPPDPY